MPISSSSSSTNSSHCPVEACATGWDGTKICIDTYGDKVWVYDGKSDGNSALGWIVSSSGSVTQRYCRNPHGQGTWARCNFDWVENVNKQVSGGVRHSYTGWHLRYLFSFDWG